MDYVTFGIIVDDVALADGTAARGLLGGGGPQTAFGMRLWSPRVGLVARVGDDLPTTCWDWLRATGIDTAGVKVTQWPTLRAWQRVGAEGGRQHEWQVPGEAIAAQLARSVAEVPESYRQARGWHLGLHPETPDLDFLRALRALGGLVSVETFRPAQTPPAPEDLQALLACTDIFSPNLSAARSLVGPGAPEDLVGRLLDAGARVVALRMGAAGSLAADAASGQWARVPAVPVQVVDPVGAGNAYCGGFLTGWVETGDLAEAGRRGAVAASFMLEQVGLPPAESRSQTRLQWRPGAPASPDRRPPPR